ncbi:MAG: threonine dehydratase [Proteobacteria bacterium]|nr:threonine dehydratase [Pseudomonadota bacterium]
MSLFTLNEIEQAVTLVHAAMPPTPQYAWPQICEKASADVWVKHENHTPTDAFKIRGGITFIDWLRRTHPEVTGIVTATRGNHGQSQARAALAAGLSATVVVPFGNSLEKNAAMRAFGATVIEFGADFDEARQQSARLAESDILFPVPPFHRELVRGVATYAFELFKTAPQLDTVYAPIGCGSGVCGIIAARDVLGLKTKIVGVVSTLADGAKTSFETGQLVETASAKTFAEGMAVRVPVQEAFDIYANSLERIVAVSDDEVAQAMRIYFRDTHNVAEGAGAASLAALLQERDRMRGRSVGVILSGGNVDADIFGQVLAGQTPVVE